MNRTASAEPGRFTLPVSTALKSLRASAVVYGELDAQGIAFDGVDEALRMRQTELRLFGKPR